MTRKAAADSLAGKVAKAQAAHKEYDIPEGMESLNKSERIVWNQYVRARTDWKESEFRTLHRIVKLEGHIREISATARQTPALYEKVNGDLAPHPIHSELRNAVKMLHTELKMVGLQVDRQRAGTIGQDGVQAPQTTRGKKAPTTPTGMSLVG